MIRDPDPLHRRSIRLRDFDYAQHGAYFVTICVHHRQCLLSEIVNGEVRLSPFGEIVEEIWSGLPDRYPRLSLDAYVIMPNHFHGILMITDVPEESESSDHAVGAIHELPLHKPPPDATERMDRLQRRKMLLPRAIGYFKMNTAKRVNILRETPGLPFWQRNYYEHVIRHDREWDALRDYIVCNPGRWADDPDHPANIREHP